MPKQIAKISVSLIRQKKIIFVLIFAIAMIVTGMYRFEQQNKRLKYQFTKQIQDNELKNTLTQLFLYIKEAESANSGYAISGDKEFFKNFDPGIKLIRATYLRLQYLQSRDENKIEAALFVRSDSLMQQKIAWLQLVKKYCDNHNRKAALALIAEERELRLTDSITKVNNQINDKLNEQVEKSETGFQKVNSKNEILAYYLFAASLLLILLIFYFLIKQIRISVKVSEELREQKEHFRVTLNSISEGLITTDLTGMILYMNPTAERLTGWSNAEAWNQPLQKIYNVVNEETGRPFEDVVSRILKDGKKIELENNTILKAKNSDTFIISNNGSPIFDERGIISGVVLVFNDITEKKRIENELKENEKRMVKAIIETQEQERHHIGQELHDNINQILVGSLLSLGMAKEKQHYEEKALHFMEITQGYIRSAIEEIRKLSHQLAPASFADMPLKGLFENLLAGINVNDRFAIYLRFDEMDKQLSPDIQINLYRILQEQIKNILKYSDASSIEISVTQKGNNVIMRIFDNGKGFNPKMVKKGIGLGNIQKRAESFSGKYILNSATGKGCEIIVEIPLGNTQ